MSETGKPDPEIARQALAEAQERHRKSENDKKARQKELNGRKGPEPTRYGDWENKGIVSDF